MDFVKPNKRASAKGEVSAQGELEKRFPKLDLRLIVAVLGDCETVEGAEGVLERCVRVNVRPYMARHPPCRDI